MNKCKICGTEFESRFCPNCGTEYVEEILPEENEPRTRADELTDDVLKYGIKHVWKINDKNTGVLTLCKAAHYLFLLSALATIAILIYFYATKNTDYTSIRTVLILALISLFGNCVFGNIERLYEKLKISDFISKQSINIKKIALKGEIDFEGNLSGDASGFFADDNIWTEACYFSENPQGKKFKIASCIISCIVSAVSILCIYFMFNFVFIFNDIKWWLLIPFFILLFLGDAVSWILNKITKKRAKEWLLQYKRNNITADGN